MQSNPSAPAFKAARAQTLTLEKLEKQLECVEAQMQSLNLSEIAHVQPSLLSLSSTPHKGPVYDRSTQGRGVCNEPSRFT